MNLKQLESVQCHLELASFLIHIFCTKLLSYSFKLIASAGAAGETVKEHGVVAGVPAHPVQEGGVPPGQAPGPDGGCCL